MQAPEQGLPELREWLWHEDIIEVHVFWLQGTPIERERGGVAKGIQGKAGRGKEGEKGKTGGGEREK